MTADPLWGILGITAFALAGFGLLASGGLIQRLPARLRAFVGAIGLALYAAFLSYGLHRAIFQEGGLVDRRILPADLALPAWALLSLLVAGIAVHRARAAITSNRSTGTGTSA